MRRLGLALIGVLWGSLAGAAETAPIPVRVVVVTTFEVGQDTGDIAGEFQDWVERFPLSATLDFPQGYHPLRYNAERQVLGIVTGEGKSHAAASIMALGLDPRFDLSKAYWILAGIAGIDPAKGSIGSAAWAKYAVDGDLAYEIDAREIPGYWATGIIPFDRATPYEPPTPPEHSNAGDQVFHLNEALVDWAFGLTRDVTLPDDPKLQAARAGYVAFPAALRPPFVLEGDTLTGDRFWLGSRLTQWAERWTSYWTQGHASFATSAEEDTGYLQALTFLTQAHRADFGRVLDLRTASDYTLPPAGKTAPQLLAAEAHGDYGGYGAAVEAAYRVASVVVGEIAQHWDRYAEHPPTAKP